jgi:hypothetical protein
MLNPRRDIAGAPPDDAGTHWQLSIGHGGEAVARVVF